MARTRVNMMLGRSKVTNRAAGRLRAVPTGGEADITNETGIAVEAAIPGAAANIEGRVSTAMLGGAVVLLLVFYGITRGKQQ